MCSSIIPRVNPFISCVSPFSWSNNFNNMDSWVIKIQFFDLVHIEDNRILETIIVGKFSKIDSHILCCFSSVVDDFSFFLLFSLISILLKWLLFILKYPYLLIKNIWRTWIIIYDTTICKISQFSLCHTNRTCSVWFIISQSTLNVPIGYWILFKLFTILVTAVQPL